MIWIILMCLFIVGIVFFGINDAGEPMGFCIIGALVMFICFLAVPVRGYMYVDSYHWNWTVDILTFSAVNKDGKTGNYSYRDSAKEAARNAIPAEAYNISIETYEDNREVVDSEWEDPDGTTHKTTHTEWYYYARYTYTINEWIKTSEVNSYGNDKNPHEPERPYDTDAPAVLGNRKCQAGHQERYTVTGRVNEEVKTYDVDKVYWDQLLEKNDQFRYTKFRFGNKIWGLEFAR